MNLHFSQDELRPLIQAVVRETLQQIEAEHAATNGRLAFSEGEAASLLGVQRHTLRDCRRRGEISARKVGKEYRYTREELERFLGEDEGRYA